MGSTVNARASATEGNEVSTDFHVDEKSAAVRIWRDVVETSGVDDTVLARECRMSPGYFSKVSSGAQGCLLALVYRVGRARPALRREFFARLAEREGLDLADIAAEQLAITAIRFLRARRRTFPGPRMAKAALVFVLALAVPRPALAADRTSAGALIAASIADAVTTEVTIHTTPGAYEANPLLGGSAVRREATKAATTAALVWGLDRVAHTHPRLATMLRWTAAGSLTAIAAHNAQLRRDR